jgi:hypothetical protein
MRLKEIFENLRLFDYGSEEKSYIIEHVPTLKNMFIAKSPDGYPAVLMRVNIKDKQRYKSLDLNGIKTEFGLNCEYSLEGEASQESVFNVVICTDENETAQDFFFDFFERFFNKKRNITSLQLKKEIELIRELFSYKKNPGRKQVMGLWSELFVIYKSLNPELWIDAWHTKARSTFDYKIFNLGIDVKSFGTNKREHHFKLEQLNNISVEQTIIISMNLQEDDGENGLSVFEIFQLISKKVKDEKLIKKLEKLIFKIGGKENDDAKKFNLEIANNSLKILRGSEVPRINHKNIPQGVSDISFLADCSSINLLNFDKKIQDKLEKGNKI